MEYPPSKRRKTSPTPSIQLEEHATRRRPASQDGHSGFSRRASYLSPTKVSLARFHPSLLRPISQNNNERIKHQFNGTGDGRTHQRPLRVDRVPQQASLNAEEQGNTELPNVQSPTEAAAGDRMHFVGAKVFMNMDTRASPPEEAGTQDYNGRLLPNTIIANQRKISNGSSDERLLSGSRRQSPSTPTRSGASGVASGMSVGDDGEPSLPSTPVHLGVERPPEPPRGLLFRDAIQRPKKTGSKTSPLKTQLMSHSQPLSMATSSSSGLGLRVYISNTPRPLQTAQDIVLTLKTRLSRLEHQLRETESALLQGILFSKCKQSDRKGATDVLKREKEAITKSAQLARIRNELRQAESMQEISQQRIVGQEAQSLDDALIIESKTADRPGKIFSQQLIQFLPFSEKPRSRSPRSDSPSSTNLSGLFTNTEDTIDDEAPFEVNISDFKVLEDVSENNLLQRQVLELSSLHRLLIMKLEVIIKPATSRLIHFRIMELSPWAEKEFGSWLGALSAEQDLAIVGLAFGSYSSISLERLRCWNDIALKFGDLFVNDSDAPEFPLLTANMNHAHVASALCRSKCLLAHGAVSLNVTWTVSINDAGEVHNEVSVHPDFPGSWRKMDTTAELSKIAEAFDMIMDEHGAAEAILDLVPLVFSS